MEESRSELLKRELGKKLDPCRLVAFEDEDLKTLIGIRCYNLDILSVQPAEYLMKAGLSATLINILAANNLIGGGHGSSGAGATARGDLLPSPPPAGAVLPLMEVHRDGSKSLLGTIAILSPKGMAITARHVVVWADGFIHPRRLWVADGVVLRHVISFPRANVSLFQLTRSTDGSASSSGGGSVAVSAEEPWPFLEIAPEESYFTGARLAMCSYRAVAEGPGLTAPGLSCTHGLMVRCSHEELMCAADYPDAPGSCGGAVLCDGKFIGTHIGRTMPEGRGGKRPSAAATDESDVFELGEVVVAPDGQMDPVEPSAATVAAAGGVATEAGDGGQQAVQGAGAAGAGVQLLTAQVEELDIDEPRESAPSLFTPWHVVAVGMQIVGIPPPQSGLTRVFSNLEVAAALAGIGPAAGERLQEHREHSWWDTPGA